ncbi:alpha/beta fold hydrolase [Kalamiella sp. sgz302252]|uniref:alpha/beta fold hydrolase n=1 Tax=Pantoea sp. sgz302252 TaxID=3341827 RepID=UPI0036D41EE5
MKAETEIVDINGWLIHVEKYCYPGVVESLICVNGALSTTLAFRNCVKSFKHKVNVILFDLPFIGQSRTHNVITRPLPKSEEVIILNALIARYSPDYLLSVSWGGLAALMTLATGQHSIRKAVIASFSPTITPAMASYIKRARMLLDEGKNEAVATLLNDEVGKYLPGLLKQVNHEHIKSLDKETYQQASFHIGQINQLRLEDYVAIFKKIEQPVLFVNGELDEYTRPEDIRLMADYVRDCDFRTVPEAGHFLDMETRAAAQQVHRILNDYFAPAGLLPLSETG